MSRTVNDRLDEVALQIGYYFDNPQILKQALSHRSYSTNNNERLEFLGDSILGFCIADVLYRNFPNVAEGVLTRMRARLVRRETLAAIGRSLDLSDYLLLGQGEAKSGGHDRDSILADSLEAIIGAVYLDGGMKPAQRLIEKLFRDHINHLNPDTLGKDPKTRLQEWLQRHDKALPDYEVTLTEGPPHDQQFTVACHLSELKETIIGQGSSRRKAEQAAAAHAYRQLVESDDDSNP